MAILIEKSKNEQYKDLFKASGLQPFEYAILSKDTFEEPLVGTSEHGEWNKYDITVHEYKSVNPDTGITSVEKPEQVYGWFAGGKSLIPKIVGIPLGQKFKLSQIKLEGKAYSLWQVEIINADGSLTEVTIDKSSTPTSVPPKTKVEAPTGSPELTLDDKIKQLKSSNMLSEVMIQALATEYEMTVEFVTKRASVL
jgi:hypothetical protein